MKFFKKKIDLNDIPLADYVVFSIKMIIAYTIVILILAVCRVEVSALDTLTTCYYSVFGGEILSCALIKIFKLHKEIKIKDQ